MSAGRFIPTAAAAIATMALLIPGSAGAQQQNKTAPAPVASSAPAATAAASSNEAESRIQGEKRFQANCGRCHQSPHKFPPRMVLTIERHMRVRTTLTDEDMRLIVGYLLQ